MRHKLRIALMVAIGATLNMTARATTYEPFLTNICCDSESGADCNSGYSPAGEPTCAMPSPMTGAKALCTGGGGGMVCISCNQGTGGPVSVCVSTWWNFTPYPVCIQTPNAQLIPCGDQIKATCIWTPTGDPVYQPDKGVCSCPVEGVDNGPCSFAPCTQTNWYFQ